MGAHMCSLPTESHFNSFHLRMEHLHHCSPGAGECFFLVPCGISVEPSKVHQGSGTSWCLFTTIWCRLEALGLPQSATRNYTRKVGWCPVGTWWRSATAPRMTQVWIGDGNGATQRLLLKDPG